MDGLRVGWGIEHTQVLIISSHVSKMYTLILNYHLLIPSYCVSRQDIIDTTIYCKITSTIHWSKSAIHTIQYKYQFLMLPISTISWVYHLNLEKNTSSMAVGPRVGSYATPGSQLLPPLTPFSAKSVDNQGVLACMKAQNEGTTSSTLSSIVSSSYGSFSCHTTTTPLGWLLPVPQEAKRVRRAVSF